MAGWGTSLCYHEAKPVIVGCPHSTKYPFGTAIATKKAWHVSPHPSQLCSMLEALFDAVFFYQLHLQNPNVARSVGGNQVHCQRRSPHSYLRTLPELLLNSRNLYRCGGEGLVVHELYTVGLWLPLFPPNLLNRKHRDNSKKSSTTAGDSKEQPRPSPAFPSLPP